ncbi:MAG: tetratricopeptide repeat protein [Gemmatimonadota bacterium]
MVPVSRRLRTITPPPPFLGWAREAASLDGVDPELGLAFWRVLRRVRAWAETPPGERARRFGSGRDEARERLGVACAHAPALVEALGTFALLVRAPGEVEPRRLSEACRQVHAWAEERSLLPVAMLFAEAAAYADPDDPARANDAGRMCRRAAQDERASSWYHRGYGLGVRRQDDTETIRAQIGYGNLMKDLGQYDEARKYFERAARRAINTGRKRQAGEAHHDLLAIAAEVGTYAEAERHVRRALTYYPIRHPRLPALLHDWAFLHVRLHIYAPAIPLLDLAVQKVTAPELKTLFSSTLAWAVAGAGRRDEFERIESEAVLLAGKHQEHAAAALIHLSEGARALSLWGRAELYAARAVDIAAMRKEAALEGEGLGLLEAIMNRIGVPREECAPNPDRLSALTQRFQARLRSLDAPRRRQPGASEKRQHPSTS